MKIENVEKGHKAKFDSIEDVLQTFFSIARAIYDVSDEDDNFSGLLTATATVPGKGTIRIRVDYPQGEDHEE